MKYSANKKIKMNDQLYKKFVLTARSTDNFEDVRAMLTNIIDGMIFKDTKYPEAIRLLEHLEALIYCEAETEGSISALRNYLNALDFIQTAKNKFDYLIIGQIDQNQNNKINKP